MTDAAVQRLKSILSGEGDVFHWKLDVSADCIRATEEDRVLIFKEDQYNLTQYYDTTAEVIDDLPDAGDLRPSLEGSLWSRELLHGLALYVREAALKAFTLAVKEGLLQLHGSWDDFRNPLEKVPPHAWPDHPEQMLAHGYLSILNGTMKLPNGQTINAIEIERLDIATESNVEMMLIWALAEPTRMITKKEFQKKLSDRGRSLSHWDLDKADFRSYLNRHHSDLAAIYSRNDPAKPQRLA